MSASAIAFTRSHAADSKSLTFWDINVCRLSSLRDDKKSRLSGIFQSLNAKPKGPTAEGPQNLRTTNFKDPKVEVPCNAPIDQARRWVYPAGDMRGPSTPGNRCSMVPQITQLVDMVIRDPRVLSFSWSGMMTDNTKNVPC